MISDSVKILAEYIEYILVLSQHKEEGLYSFISISEVIGRLSLEDSFEGVRNEVGIFIFLKHMEKCILHILELQYLPKIVHMKVLYLLKLLIFLSFNYTFP